MRTLTFKQVRDMFFDNFQISREYIKDGKKGYWRPKTQNEYNTDTRCAFVDYVDSLHRDGVISEATAYNITLR